MGQKTFLMSLCQLKPHCASSMWAPKHNNFVYLKMGTSGRRRDSPESDTSQEHAEQSNEMAAFVCSAIRLMPALCIFWIIEQPFNSLFSKLPVVLQRYCSQNGF